MKPMKWVLLLFFAAAGSALAQTEERPKIAVPEPSRADAQRTFTVTLVGYDQAIETNDRFSNALPELVHFFTESTDFNATLTWNERNLNDPRPLQSVLLYLTGNDAVFDFNQHEKKKLGQYLKSGGMLYAEDVRPRNFRAFRRPGAGVSGTPFDQQFKALMKDELVLGGSGGRWKKVPKDHPLYSSYFTFPDGPPLPTVGRGHITYLEMLELRGRVAVIFSDLNISLHWGDKQVTSRERGLQFGTNLMVFAITQRVGGGLISGK